MSEFNEWFKNQDFYLNMRFIHGDKLFDKDGDVYRVLPVQMAFKAREDLQKRCNAYSKAITSIRNEFDLWSDDSEFADVIEAQIENLELLRGEHE